MTKASSTIDKRNLRRDRTRAQLIAAARTEMAEHGLEATTISNIIARAGLGKGSFYNHFADKEALLNAVMDQTIATIAEQILSLTDLMHDPAEILATSIRHFLRMCSEQPEVGHFIVRGAAGRNLVAENIGPWARRDIQNGIDAGVFSDIDLGLFEAIFSGSLESVLRALLNQQLKPNAAANVAAAMLQLLGVNPEQAQKIVAKPLPPIPQLVAQNL